MSSRFIVTCGLMMGFFLCGVRPAAAVPGIIPDIDCWRLVIGPGVAYGWESDGGSGVVTTVDTSLSYALFWGTLGFRHVYHPAGDLEVLGGYVEGGRGGS